MKISSSDTTPALARETTAPPPPLPRPDRYKWGLLVLLWIAFFLHQGDRQIYNSIIPLIKTGLGLSDVQLGLVGSVFTLVYGLLVPLAGLAGDFFPRKRVIMASLLIFSLGTLLSGVSTGLVMFIIFRSMATGGGEAFFYPAAVSLLAQFHEKTRAQALGILQTALYTGITVSALIAGYIGDHFGWRAAFFTFGGAGLVWSVVVGRLVRATPHAVAAAGTARVAMPWAAALAAILGRPTAWLLALASGSMVYVNNGYVTWTPTFLHERFGLSLAQAGFYAMFFHNAAAFLGVLIGGRITDPLAGRSRYTRMAAVFLGLVLAAPFIFWIGRAGSAGACYLALAGFGLFRGIYDSNLFAALYDVVEPRLRATATGLMLSFAFVVSSFAPTVLGWMKTRVGLAAGLSSLGWFYLMGSFFVLMATLFFLRRDRIAPLGGCEER